MSELYTIISAVLPVFLIIAIGWGMRRRGWISDQGEKDIIRLVVYILYPCLVLGFVLGNEQLRDAGIVAEALSTGFLMIVGGLLVGLVIGPLLGFRLQKERSTFALCAAVFNFGYMAIPVAAFFMDSQAIGVMLVVNVGIDLAIWSVGITLLSGKLSRQSLRHALSPPVLAVLIGLPLNYVGADAHMPLALSKMIEMLGASALPIGIVIIGASFGNSAKIAGLRPPANVVAGTVLMRHLLLPALMFALVWLIPFSLPVQQTILIHAAMPAGIFVAVICGHYGGSGKLAFHMASTSSVLGLLTIPLWLSLGTWLFG